jgi:hypothetical protein
VARERPLRLEILGAVLSTVVALVSGLDAIGHVVRTVHLLTIFAGGLGAGVGIAQAVARVRAERRAREAGPSAERAPEMEREHS